ncbi:UV radiation resistance protein/autophagy-related protein 14 [Tanacetum coccineum]
MINSVVALREKLHFHKDQPRKDKAKVQKMGADLKVRFESLELSKDELERSRKEQLEKYYPNLICTQSIGHVNTDGDRHDLGFRGQNQPLKLKVNQYYTLLGISQTQKVLEVLKNFPEKSIQVIVFGERILGLGDLGVWEFQLGNSLYIPHLEELGLLWIIMFAEAILAGSFINRCKSIYFITCPIQHCSELARKYDQKGAIENFHVFKVALLSLVPSSLCFVAYEKITRATIGVFSVMLLIFHVDKYNILGHDPKTFPPPMKLCKEMLEAIGGAERCHHYEHPGSPVRPFHDYFEVIERFTKH